MTYQFKPKLLPALAGLLLLPLLLSLGVWQLHRAEYKRQLQAQYNNRLHAAPLTINQLSAPFAQWQYYPLTLTGHFDNAHTLLLDNKFFQHQVGYQVLTPFFSDKSSTVILINRGWIPQGRTRAQLPVIPPVLGQVTLTGLISLPPSKTFTLGQTSHDDKHPWPRLIEQLQTTELAKNLGYPLAPFVLLLNPDQSHGFSRDWSPVTMRAEMHIGYAIQWFALAIALVILLFIVSIKREKLSSNESNSG